MGERPFDSELNLDINNNLTTEKLVETGSFYTPSNIVEIALTFIKPYLSDNMIIGDFGAGYGAFIKQFQQLNNKLFATEFENSAFDMLKRSFTNIPIYKENSLCDVNRSKYSLEDDDILVAIGNPPYNDITSQYKKGDKGSNNCDSDIVSRDLGVSFLKMYSKLSAEFVCVLHPLSYLIKKQNFSSLKVFKDNYTILRGLIFSSKEFKGISPSNSDFPVVLALYRRSNVGMNFDYIKQFEFEILNSNKKFTLGSVYTIDGIVNKYPKKGCDIGLQFYALRDMNALMRNAGFVENRPTNGVPVDIKNLYQYCWLWCLKSLFSPPVCDRFLFGNLSPIYSHRIAEDSFKGEVVSFAYNSLDILKKYFSEADIIGEYGEIQSSYDNVMLEISKLSKMFLEE